MKNTLRQNKLVNMCFVVPDIEKAATTWAELLGIEKPEIRQIRLEGSENYTYRG